MQYHSQNGRQRGSWKRWCWTFSMNCWSLDLKLEIGSAELERVGMERGVTDLVLTELFTLRKFEMRRRQRWVGKRQLLVSELTDCSREEWSQSYIRCRMAPGVEWRRMAASGGWLRWPRWFDAVLGENLVVCSSTKLPLPRRPPQAHHDDAHRHRPFPPPACLPFPVENDGEYSQAIELHRRPTRRKADAPRSNPHPSWDSTQSPCRHLADSCFTKRPREWSPSVQGSPHGRTPLPRRRV